MARAAVIVILLGMLASLAVADTLVLTDGRTFTGTVSEDDDEIVIELAYATLRFPRSQISRIVKKPTPAQELESKLAEIRRENVQALYNAGVWAQENDLDGKAVSIFEKVITLSPDHKDAHKQLGHVQVDKEWLTTDKAMELARSKLQAGEYPELIETYLPALEEVVTTSEQATAVAWIEGLALMRTGEFSEAAEVFEALGQVQENTRITPEKIRYRAIAEVLDDNDDGMVLLEEDYPPSSALLDDTEPIFKAGPISLKHPKALDAILRQKAKEDIDAGRKLLAEARKDDATDPDAARSKITRALAAFDRADALVEDISRTYRVEVARREISSIREGIEADADRFDKLIDKLGTRNMSPKAYRTMVLQLVHRVNNITDALEQILDLASNYERELVLEIQWAKADIKKMDSLRKVLKDELSDE